jgi:hypothetical protein
MIADDDLRIRHDFGYKGEKAVMERFIAPYPALVALSAKIRQKTIEAWAAGDGETPDEDAWESGDPDNPGVVELVFGFQEQYATVTGALVDGFSEGGEYDYDAYFARVWPPCCRTGPADAPIPSRRQAWPGGPLLSPSGKLHNQALIWSQRQRAADRVAVAVELQARRA